MSDFILEVGKQYLNKNGQRIVIKEAISDLHSEDYLKGYRFIDTKGYKYTSSGQCNLITPSMLDIDPTAPGRDWFQRHSDLSDPRALVRSNPLQFANECAAAIQQGKLKFIGGEEY